MLALGDRPYRVSIEDLDADDPLDPSTSVWTPAMLRANYRGPAIVIRPLATSPAAAPR